MSAVPLVEQLDVSHWPAQCRHAVDLQVGKLADGSMLKVPVLIACGSQSGPCLVAIAGVHGDEAEGILTLTTFVNEVPADFRGRLILVPIANPPAFESGERCSPLDGLDLNRIFPGKPGGSPSERLAHVLMSEVVTHADFLCSLHSWFATGTTLPFVEVWSHDSPVAARGYEGARACGFERIRLTSWPEGLLVRIANESGIAAIEMEIGGAGRSRADHRQAYKSHLIGLMQHLDMIDGTPKPNPRAGKYDGQHVRCQRSGVLRSRASLGATVAAGDLLATIHDLQGGSIEDIRAPQDGIVVALREYASAASGDSLFLLFSPRP